MNPYIIFCSFLIGLCWGSFLNVVAYRITFDKNFWAPRSRCPHCNKMIAWYHNIPVASYFMLKGKCASCSTPISILYPLIELVTGIAFAALAFKFLPQQIPLFVTYAFFISALIATTRSDLEAMLIPQLFTLYLIPVGIGCSYFGWTNITPHESALSALFAYGFLWGISKLFKLVKGQEGLGIGDAELLAMIGSFLGICGMWNALMIGSCIGCVIIITYLWYTQKGRETRIPFGPFLALGAIMSLLVS